MRRQPLQLLKSGLLSVPHAFTTRFGGVSSTPFESLNFGNPSELPPGIDRDPKSNIEANFDRVLDAIGCEERRVVHVHQVHGADVLVARTPRAQQESTVRIDWGSVKADAIVTDDPALVVAVRVADCCPVLLASGDGKIVAAVHAGWRGVVGGVAPAAIAEMRRLGAAEISAAIGPCISTEHFEVGPEVVQEFSRAFSDLHGIARLHPAPLAAAAGKSMIDLKEALRRQMLSVGVSRIDVVPHCTVRDSDLFFSHRRDHGVTGRMIGIIGLIAG